MNDAKLNQIVGLGRVWVPQFGMHKLGKAFIMLQRRACCKSCQCCQMVWRLFLYCVWRFIHSHCPCREL